MNRTPVVAPRAKIHPAVLNVPVDELWTPIQLGYKLVAWWDILTDPYVNEGDGVKIWHDKSGNGNDLAQYDHSKQPDWIQHTFSPSKPGVVFDGVDDRLVCKTMNVSQPFSVLQIVQSGASQQDYAAIFGGSPSDAAVYAHNKDVNGNIAIRAGDNAVDSGVAMAPNSTYIVVTQFNGDQSSISLNGSQKITMPGTGSYGIVNGPSI